MPLFEADIVLNANKIGRDAHNLIDFSTDNQITVRVNNVAEYEFRENVFNPTSTDGAALGDANHLWSDLFLRTGAVINFNQSDVLLTHSGDLLTLTGGGLTVGVDDTGHDVKFFGATSGKNLLWDESGDRLIFQDNTYLALGSGSDMLVYHTGSHGNIGNYTGNLTIENNHNDGDIIFSTEDGSNGVTPYITLDGSEGTTVFNKNLHLVDSVRLVMGTGSDFQILHDGNHAYVHNTVGTLEIRNYATDGDITFMSDNGSGGEEIYFFLDGSQDSASPYTVFPDSAVLSFGAAYDTIIYHNSPDTYIQQQSGDLYIQNDANDKDIILVCDDGSNGVTPYLTLDGGLGYMVASKQIRFADGVNLYFGNGNDAQVKHDGSNFSIVNSTGNLTIDSAANDADIIFKGTDGGSDITALTLDMSAGGAATFINDITINKGSAGNPTLVLIENSGGTQNAKIEFDQSAQNQLYITTNYASPNDTNRIFLQPGGYSALIAYGGENGISSTKVEITNELEAKVSTFAGTLTVGVDDTGHDVKFFGATSGEYMLWDESEDALFLADNTQLRIGAGGDLRAYHNGTNSYFGNYTGDLFIFNNANDKDIVFQCDDGSNGTTAYLTLDGSATTINVAKNMHFGDGVYANFGASSDIEIAHVNNQSYIINNVGNLEFRQNTNDGDIIFQCDDGSNGVTPYITLDGSAANIKIATDMIFADNKAAMFGTGGDAFLKHDGSNCNFINDTGNVTFTNRTDDGDIIFSSDNGSGGTAEYFRVDGGGGVTYFSKHLQMADSQNIYVGGGGDMSIVHDGTNSFIVNSTGNLTIDSATNNADIIFKGTDGGADITALTLDMSAGGKGIFAGSVSCTTLVPSSHIYLGATKHLYLDGGGNTSIRESSADTIQLTCGGSVRQTITTSKTTFAGELEATTLDINGAADISGNLTGIDTLTAEGVAATNNLTTPLIQMQGNITLLNKAQSAYLDFAVRNTSGSEAVYNLDNVGTLTVDGKIETAGEIEGGSLDINGAADISGALTGVDAITMNGALSGATTIGASGNVTAGHIIIGDDGNIGSASDPDAIAIDDSGLVLFSGAVEITGNLEFSGAARTLSNSTGDLTVDVAGDIILDADSNDVVIKDAGASRLNFNFTNSGHFYNVLSVADKTWGVKGTDGSTAITALSIDMAAAGKATFNNDVVAFSDRKLKENIQTLDGKKVLEMRGVSFTRKDTKEQSSGVIAQEMQKVAPELVSESQGTLGVSYGNLVGYLIEAVKDQQKQIDELKAMINGSSK